VVGRGERAVGIELIEEESGYDDRVLDGPNGYARAGCSAASEEDRGELYKSRVGRRSKLVD
jgi:hypothetical protein